MEKLGKMTQAGKKVLPDMSEKGFNIDIDILEALKKDEIVWANFHKFPYYINVYAQILFK